MSKIETNVIKHELKFFEIETEKVMLTSEWECKLDSKIAEVDNYIKNNHGKGKSDEEKDELYKNAQDLWKDYARSLRDTKYNFHLNRVQWKFLTDLILTKMEYDVNTVFLAIELTNMLAKMRDTKFSDDKHLVSFEVDATEITYIYHLISTWKVKGLTKDSYTFAQVLRRIADISKVFNYYDTAGKNSSTEIQNWAVSFEDGVTLGEPAAEVVEGKSVKPKKKVTEEGEA